jgi:hypothetical protein
MAFENELNYPSTVKSAGFALTFFAIYVLIVFAVLGLFFRIPF